MQKHVTVEKAEHTKYCQGYRTKQAMEEYHEKRRVEKRMHRSGKREWKTGVEELELMKTQNDSRYFYRTLNFVRNPFRFKVTMCKDEVENILSKDQIILDHWMKHFDTLLIQNNTSVEDKNVEVPLQEVALRNKLHAYESHSRT